MIVIKLMRQLCTVFSYLMSILCVSQQLCRWEMRKRTISMDAVAIVCAREPHATSAIISHQKCHEND